MSCTGEIEEPVGTISLSISNPRCLDDVSHEYVWQLVFVIGDSNEHNGQTSALVLVKLVMHGHSVAPECCTCRPTIVKIVITNISDL